MGTQEIQRTFDFEALEGLDDAYAGEGPHSASRVAHPVGCLVGHEFATYRTGELIRDILQVREESGASLLGNQLESEVSLENFPSISLEDLSKHSPTFGKKELQKLLAAVELGRRVAEAKSNARGERVQLSSSTAAIGFCRDYFRRLAQDGLQEEFHILTLDTKNRFVGSHLITLGTLNASLVHPREVFRPAIRDSAAAIIAVHNHPSGTLRPHVTSRNLGFLRRKHFGS